MNPRNRALALAASVLVTGLGGYEGLELVDYWDRLPARPVATACYGHTATAKVGTVRSKDECDALLVHDLNTIYGPAVLAMVNVPITQGQYNALTDFAYNLGIANLRSSTLLRKVNAGDHAGAAREFGRWVYVAGKDCRVRSNNCYGIVKRRQWEATQYAS
jgi:lysozyme